MTPSTWLLLALAGAIGGAVNSVAGGGSFLVFPAILWSGVPAVGANATTAAALWPALLASGFAYRRELAAVRSMALTLAASSAVGGLAGAFLLLRTPDATFVKVLPFLLAFAALVFSLGPRLTARLGERSGRGALWIAAALQLAISVYGGYFGGGMGIMMLATFSIAGMTHLHSMNALKTVLGAIINGLAIAYFFASGAVTVAAAVPVAVGSVIGGFVGASAARRLDAKKVRSVVLVYAWALTAYFFWRSFGA